MNEKGLIDVAKEATFVYHIAIFGPMAYNPGVWPPPPTLKSSKIPIEGLAHDSGRPLVCL
jgi:hypothetical protein